MAFSDDTKRSSKIRNLFRIAPASAGQPVCFAVKRGQADNANLSVSPQVAALKQLRTDLANAPWPLERMGNPELAIVNPKTNLRALRDDTEVSFVPMQAVGENTNSYTATDRLLGEVRSGYRVFVDGDISGRGSRHVCRMANRL